MSQVDPNYLRQIKEPSVAKGNYPNNYDGIKDAFTTFFPESLGYMVGYGFTGLGDPTEKSKWSLDTLGMGGPKKKVLGANYFVKSNEQCGNLSAANCMNHTRYDYVRTYPLYGYGAITGVSDDIVDLNPVTLMNSYFQVNNFSKNCSEVTLPVGNNFLDPSLEYKDANDFTTKRDACLKDCQSNDRNCQRFCKRGWWKETRCSASPVGVNVKYGEDVYTIPNGVGDISQLSNTVKTAYGDITRGFQSLTDSNGVETFSTSVDTVLSTPASAGLSHQTVILSGIMFLLVTTLFLMRK